MKGIDKHYEMLRGRGMAWNLASGATAGKLSGVHEGSSPELWYPVSLSVEMPFFKYWSSYIVPVVEWVSLNSAACCLLSIGVKQPRVQLKVIWTIWTCWDVRKAGNLTKTGFLWKFLALPFLVLFGEAPKAHILPIFYFGVLGLSQVREASKEQWKWKIKIMISILNNSWGNNSPHGLKAFSKEAGKSTSCFAHGFNEFQNIYNTHKYLLTNISSVLSQALYVILKTVPNCSVIYIYIYIHLCYDHHTQILRSF